ncbi:MAG: MarR family winged helix-turn-helix transcriptional regulator [Parvularcula sp.]
MADQAARQKRQAQGVAQLLEQVSRRVLEQRGVDDLHAAQWSALRYFSRAGRRAANVAGLARYLGNTAAPASRTARSLVDRGLLESAPSPHDARSMVFTLTTAGHDCLARDPLGNLAVIAADLPSDRLARLGECLEYIHMSLDHQKSQS